ncbi:MAG: DAK2 domain-containing protein [Anaerolineae bacterium]
MSQTDTDTVIDIQEETLVGNERPGQRCDAVAMRRALAAGLAWLEHHSEAINALNVFPVPDGDTGTNMVLTLRAAMAEAEAVAGHRVADLMAAVAHGALMGARGNSGVILSQLLRGMAQTLADVDECTPKAIGEAFASARDMAYQGVMRPVEGTILTVAKEVAAATSLAARNESIDFRQLFATATDAARHAVAATPSQLPVLAEAGVVDAGGQGLFIILEGIFRYLSGSSVESNGSLRQNVDLATFGSEQEYGYDVQFIIHGRNLDVSTIREELAGMGDSLLVVGDAGTVKVHIHTDRPGDPINYGVAAGSVADVVVENMQEQYQSFIAQRTEKSMARTAKEVGIVAVCQGEGFKRVLQSLGADVIVEGGQTMNPSIEELLAAAESLTSEAVILLPNNTNIIMAAQHVQTMTNKRLAVVPTRTIPEGISALLAFNYELGLDENAAAMVEASKQTQTVELTVATRSACINGLKVKEGQFIAILNTELVAAGNNLTQVALKAFTRFPVEDYEITTIYYGQDVNEDAATTLSAIIKKKYPGLDVEIVEGSQPYYHFIVAIE